MNSFSSSSSFSSFSSSYVEAHANLRRAVNAEIAAREKSAAELHDRVDDETEARLADGAAFQEMLSEETRAGGVRRLFYSRTNTITRLNSSVLTAPFTHQ